MAEIESTSNSDFAAAMRERDRWRLRYKELEAVDKHLNEECRQLRAEVMRLRKALEGPSVQVSMSTTQMKVEAAEAKEE